MHLTGKEWEWENIRSFFINNIDKFEHEMGL